MFEQSQPLEEYAPILNEEQTEVEDAENIPMPVKPDDLSFSWFLNKVVREGRNVCQPNKTLLRQEDLPYHVHLFVAFILFLVATVIGSVHLNACSNERMISVFLIVQGACGLFIVLVHIAAAIFQ